jgi:hypothetical protein
MTSPTDPSLHCGPVVNIFSAMTHSSLAIRTWCIGIIAALTLTSAIPAWAEETGPEYTDPTIVSENPDETPDGVKNLGTPQVSKKFEHDTPPIYTKWWFWAIAVGVTATVATLAVLPLHMPARGCSRSEGSGIPLNCYGDGRAP